MKHLDLLIWKQNLEEINDIVIKFGSSKVKKFSINWRRVLNIYKKKINETWWSKSGGTIMDSLLGSLISSCIKSNKLKCWSELTYFCSSFRFYWIFSWEILKFDIMVLSGVIIAVNIYLLFTLVRVKIAGCASVCE